jgi:Tfp pilus assembly protein PilO
MIRIADFLDRKERRSLILLAILFAAAFLFLLAGGLGARREGLRARAALRSARDAGAKAEADRADKQAGFDLWEAARRDLAEMRGKELYEAREGIGVLRFDIDRLLVESGLGASRLSYSYGTQEKGVIYRVGVSFELRGSYAALKSMLEKIESFPRLLVVDGVDLRAQAGGASGGPALRLTLGAYYEK